MKILLTGGTGFVGSNLAKSLTDDGHDVILLVRRSSDLKVVSDYLDRITTKIYDGSYSSIERALDGDVELVIHCASLFLSDHNEDDVEGLVDSNIKFPSMLLEAMAKKGVTNFINTGTSWQHYNNENYNPVNLYAATKQAFDDIVRYYLEVKRIKCVTLKLFDTYGPNDHRGKLVSFLLGKLKSGGELDLSPGEQEISLVHISDLVFSYELAIQEVKKLNLGEIKSYGVRSCKTHKLRSLIEEVLIRSNNKSLTVNFGGRKYRKREVMKLWKSYDALPGWSEDNDVITYITSELD